MRKICVITGSRAEYGLLSALMASIDADPDLILQVVVTGSHLSLRYGMTANAIEEDGFRVDERVSILGDDDSSLGIAKSMGRCVEGVAKALDRLRPDVVTVLGDRFEIFASAQAAMLMRVPIAHIHGGEVTEGAMDEVMRHAITKLSHLHFVAAEEFRQRVIRMGEVPSHVFNVGAPGLDAITDLDLLSLAGLRETVDHELGDKFFLVTYHPVTLRDDGGRAVEALLSALDRFPDHQVLMTGVNADPENQKIRDAFEGYVARSKGRVHLHQSLGQLRYLSAMKHADAVIGNSSSGIIEAPALQTPAVNMGIRQKGRPHGPSVIDCEEAEADITRAIAQALLPEFKNNPDVYEQPYGKPGASLSIKEILKTISLRDIRIKPFFDPPSDLETILS